MVCYNQSSQFEGGLSDKGDVNPFVFLQHYQIYPRKPEDFIPDNRVFNLYKQQVKIDLVGIRPILIIGNIYLLATYLIQKEPTQLMI